MGFELDTIWNGVTDLVPSVSDLSNTIGDFINTSLSNIFGQVLYGIISAVNWFVAMVYQLFEIFSGQIKVSYKGDYEYLTNIFFENSTISGIYWGMAIIGVVLCFAFAIIAVVRKMFDGSDKVQTSMGAILGTMFKSILIILSLNVCMAVVLNFSNVLMQRIVYVFNAGASLTEEQEIDFTDDQYATMGRILNTIGNYSLNPSYNSRYNLNSCFNEVRADLLYLQDQGVFDFYYVTKDASGKEVETWQSALQTLVFAANLEEELKMDVYNEGVSRALLEIMNTLETNSAFYPLNHYERSPLPINNIPFDRVLFLACTYNAARNEQFNISPSHTDPLRGPYYNGEKSIYDVEQVSEDFELLWGFNYILFFLIVYGIMKEMIYILIDCAGRIYNMVALYLVAPPFIAVSPLDNGGKLKQWTLAFIVQCFGVFGTVVSMRLLLTFAPIIISADLQISTNPAMDIAAKVIMVDAGCLAARKASAMITGLLADSAGWQSITAGNLRGDYDEMQAKKARKAAEKQQNKSVGQEKADRDKKNVDKAVAGAKLASGAGSMNDVKQVAGGKDSGGGGGAKGGGPNGGGPNGGNAPKGGGTPAKTDGGPKGGGTPTKTDGGPKGGGTPTKTDGGPKGGGTPTKTGGGPTGSTGPKTGSGPNGKGAPTKVGGPNGGTTQKTGGGTNNTGSGYVGIPVPPPLNLPNAGNGQQQGQGNPPVQQGQQDEQGQLNPENQQDPQGEQNQLNEQNQQEQMNQEQPENPPDQPVPDAEPDPNLNQDEMQLRPPPPMPNNNVQVNDNNDNNNNNEGGIGGDVGINENRVEVPPAEGAGVNHGGAVEHPPAGNGGANPGMNNLGGENGVGAGNNGAGNNGAGNNGVGNVANAPVQDIPGGNMHQNPQFQQPDVQFQQPNVQQPIVQPQQPNVQQQQPVGVGQQQPVGVGQQQPIGGGQQQNNQQDNLRNAPPLQHNENHGGQ